MTQPPKRQPERSVEAHIYITPALKKRLKKYAELNHRSVNGQILHYVQSGIDHDETYHAGK